MAYYGNNNSSYSYEAERESFREQDSYSSGYNRYGAGGCASSGFPVAQHHHKVVTDVECETDVVIPRHGRHHHGGAAEYIERDERIVYERDSYGAADPCVRRPYC